MARECFRSLQRVKIGYIMRIRNQECHFSSQQQLWSWALKVLTENYFLSRNQLLVILTLNCKSWIKASSVFQTINFGASRSQKLLDDLFHQMRGNQERSHGMQDTGNSIQRPETIPRGSWGKMTQDRNLEHTWRIGVHIGQLVPGAVWQRHIWLALRGHLCHQNLGVH